MNLPPSTPILCVLGPTSAGKSAWVMAFSEYLPIEIISFDSVQVYRGMDIGTAKPKPEEREQVPHHLIDIREPWETYSAGAACRDAAAAIEDILRRGRWPVLVGGSMMYFYALEGHLSNTEASDPIRRQALLERLEKEGTESLYTELRQREPLRAASIHPNDAHRLIRALELTQASHTTQACAALSHISTTRRFKHLILDAPRPILRARVAERFDRMLHEGLIEECQTLFAQTLMRPELPALRAVGYRQMWEHLAGHIDFETMRQKAIQATGRLVKHQQTWLSKWPHAERAPLETALEPSFMQTQADGLRQFS